MARVGTCAAIALVVPVVLAASAAAEKPRCCVDFHTWGGNTGCCGADQSDACNSWCQSQCRGGDGVVN
ncbi:hypothetical protein E2562_033404 [Oryza meyeriana var. granulata]|uniref:Uncharacterized protein n=1 Tax=Oryza meyeriana var. granulata TaxID=110450 RepID=A0A6G1CV29_9ORYZ|nr:hypothetical protein E2562_033404 [Oryza meyeriana var. granulata]